MTNAAGECLIVDAIYENGVLRPLEDLPLHEHQQVQVSIQFKTALLQSLDRLADHRARLRTECGELPDSTSLIQEDRARDL
jgi:predicted DNA-binding antitoxin AbrB/MazE fold protein